jgi:RHS repeat-associated protein
MTSAGFGQVESSATYRPFGEVHATTGTEDLSLRFPGQLFDPETGFHQNWQRDYDPRLGRYLQPDPIGLKGGLNTYAYAFADPVNLIDPDGEFPILLALRLATLALTLYDLHDLAKRLLDPCETVEAKLDALGGFAFGAITKGLGKAVRAGRRAPDFVVTPRGM